MLLDPLFKILTAVVGNWTCDSTTEPRCVPSSERLPIFQKVFQKGKRYLLRLINSSTESSFVFTIDNHLLEVISTDFVPIQPFKNESIHIGIGESLSEPPYSVRTKAILGQRYSVIVEANPSAPVQADGNYWIRTYNSDGCGSINQSNPETGIIRYDPNSTTLPTSTNQTIINTACIDIPVESIVPVVPWSVDTQAVNGKEQF